MWMPTHVQVTVQKASGLLIKGKNNTNDCFVTIVLGKTKYQTSVKDKAGSDVEWHEECELPIPDQGNTAEIILTVYHHNVFGVDLFLGRVIIPLNSIDAYERPKNKWYSLQSKTVKNNTKQRGRLEVKIGSIVKSGSLSDLTKKEKFKSSIGQLSHAAQSIGGSLLSLSSVEKRKGLKKIAKSIGSKIHIKSKKKDLDLDDNSSISDSIGSFKKSNNNNNFNKFNSRQTKDDADPGVVSEDEDEFTFDDLSHKSSINSLNQIHNNSDINENFDNKTPPTKSPKPEIKLQDEWEFKLFGNKSKNSLKPTTNETINRRSWDLSKLSSQIEEEPIETNEFDTKEPSFVNKINKSPDLSKKEENGGMFNKLKHFKKDKIDVIDLKRDKSHHRTYTERIIIGGENEQINCNNSYISNELLQKFEGKSREDLILLVCNLQTNLEQQKKKNKDLEDYLDDLLLRVMETTPRILQNPYVHCKFSHKKLTS